jgi:hypothetical protein
MTDRLAVLIFRVSEATDDDVAEGVVSQMVPPADWTFEGAAVVTDQDAYARLTWGMWARRPDRGGPVSGYERYDDKGSFDPVPFGTSVRDGEEVQVMATFVCHICGKPAEHLPIRHSEAHGPNDMDFTNRKTSMTVERLYYACSDHIRDVSDQVCDEHGWSINDGPMQQPTFSRIELTDE